jgi:hypothetical protein
VSIWRDTIAFVRPKPGRTRAAGNFCTWHHDAGWPNTTLMVIRVGSHAKLEYVKKYQGRGARFHTRSPSTVEISDRYVTWFSHAGYDYDDSYLARVRDRQTGRMCWTGGGQSYKADHVYGVTRPALVGEHIVWGGMVSGALWEVLRQRGCDRQSREKANAVGQLLDSRTFVKLGRSDRGTLTLLLSESMPSFVPIP